GPLYAPVERRGHPANRRMADLPLDIGDNLAGIGLVPPPVQRLGGNTKLDNQISGKVLWLDLATLFFPQAHQGGLIVSHDDPGLGLANKGAAVLGTRFEAHPSLPAAVSTAFLGCLPDSAAWCAKTAGSTWVASSARSSICAPEPGRIGRGGDAQSQQICLAIP